MHPFLNKRKSVIINYMETCTIALFGEAERGLYKKGYFLEELDQLADIFGNPPPDSLGLFYATQALLYRFPLIFFRVQEEGFSTEDYLEGARILSESPLAGRVRAICSPGVGDHRLINTLTDFCEARRQIFITTERDFIDYLHAYR